MLKYRIMTAAVLLPLVISSILYLPKTPVAIISGAFFLLATWEWTQFLSQSTMKRALGLLSIAGVTALMSLLDLKLVLMSSFFWWVIGLLAVLFFPNGKNIWQSRSVCFVVGALLMGPSWLALLWLHANIPNGPQWLLFVLSLVWLADTAAYFSGRQWGKTPLAKSVSPKKTWQGFWGAVISTMMVSVIVALSIDLPFHLIAFMGLCLVTVLFSIVGDLIESLFKRVHDIKDSGSILPGHGGVLDRIDSLTSAIPLFTLGYMLL